MYGLLTIKSIYRLNSDAVDRAAAKTRDLYQAKALPLMKMMEQLRNREKVGKELWDEFRKNSDAIAQFFGVGKRSTRPTDESVFINWMIRYFSIGFISFLVSFIFKA